MSGIAAQQHRERALEGMNEKAPKTTKYTKRKYGAQVAFDEVDETVISVSATTHHHMSVDTRTQIELSRWLHDNRSDPATNVCFINAVYINLLYHRILFQN